MEDWMRCNKCYRGVKKPGKSFFLTQCQHVFCSRCVVEVSKQCPECKSVDVRTVPLEKPMQPALSHYFSSLANHTEQILEAAQFQRSQFLIARRRLQDIHKKYADMKRTYWQTTQELKQMISAYTELKEKLINSAIARQNVQQQRFSEPRNAQQHRSDKRTANFDFTPSSARYRQPSNTSVSQSQRTFSEAIPVYPTNSSMSRSVISHRRQQNSIAYASNDHVHQIQPKQEIMDYEYNPNPQFTPYQYQPNAILSDSIRPTSQNFHRIENSRRLVRSTGISTDRSSTGGTIRTDSEDSAKYSNYRF